MRYYVPAIIVIDAPTAQAAVNQVALLPLDFAGEPFAAEDLVGEVGDEQTKVKASEWEIPTPPECDLFALLLAWFETRRAANRATFAESEAAKLQDKYGAACDQLADVVALMAQWGLS